VAGAPARIAFGRPAAYDVPDQREHAAWTRKN
jgi:hypothetical protein